MSEWLVTFWKLVNADYEVRQLVATFKVEAPHGYEALDHARAQIMGKLEWDDEEFHRIEDAE